MDVCVWVDAFVGMNALHIGKGQLHCPRTVLFENMEGATTLSAVGTSGVVFSSQCVVHKESIFGGPGLTRHGCRLRLRLPPTVCGPCLPWIYDPCGLYEG